MWCARSVRRKQSSWACSLSSPRCARLQEHPLLVALPLGCRRSFGPQGPLRCTPIRCAGSERCAYGLAADTPLGSGAQRHLWWPSGRGGTKQIWASHCTPAHLATSAHVVARLLRGYPPPGSMCGRGRPKTFCPVLCGMLEARVHQGPTAQFLQRPLMLKDSSPTPRHGSLVLFEIASRAFQPSEALGLTPTIWRQPGMLKVLWLAPHGRN